jgi:serine/threonine protein kinase
MQHVNGIPVYNSDPNRLYEGLKNCKPTWYSAQGGVYRCRQQMSPKKLIAVKKYYVAESQDDPNAFIMPRDLVENEIYAMTRCAPHQNILELLSVHLHQECIYLVMPLCTGGSLQEYVFENRITVGQLVYILQAVGGMTQAVLFTSMLLIFIACHLFSSLSAACMKSIDTAIYIEISSATISS